MDKLSQMAKLTALLSEIIKRQFYGEIVLKFEAGKIVICRQTENIKL